MMKPLTTLKLFLLVLIVFTGSTGQGQEKINIAAGYGYPEQINLGLRFQLGQSQIGLYGGSLPGNNEKVYSLGADYYYHFGGSSELSKRRPWYAKAGLNYLSDEDEFVKNKYVFLVPRIGRDFNISRRFGVALEVGAFAVLSHSEEEIKPKECWLCEGDLMPPVFVSFGFSAFYRL